MVGGRGKGSLVGWISRIFSRRPAPLLPEFPGSPDQPQGFGYKCAWLAVRASEPEVVAKALELKNVRPATWPEGLATAYGSATALFVTPVLDGWVLAAGAAGFPDGAQDLSEATRKLSASLTTVSFGFATHRVVELQSWVRADRGQVVRAFSFLGESGETLLDVGPRLPEEAGIDFDLDLPNVSENDVIRLAGAWSIDPTTLSTHAPTPPGLVGEL